MTKQATPSAEDEAEALAIVWRHAITAYEQAWCVRVRYAGHSEAAVALIRLLADLRYGGSYAEARAAVEAAVTQHRRASA